jgi:SAM-dependent methyltransferase
MQESEASRNETTLTSRTVDNFGDQRPRYTSNDGYYGSLDLLADVFGPLRSPRGFEVQESSGDREWNGADRSYVVGGRSRPCNGRRAFPRNERLKENTSSSAERITYLHCRGDELPADLPQDIVVSIGVLRHVPEPRPVVAAAYRILKPGGKIVVWLYGWEGKGAYLSVILPIRTVTSRLPHLLLSPSRTLFPLRTGASQS